jgi:hypothetical protein
MFFGRGFGCSSLVRLALAAAISLPLVSSAQAEAPSPGRMTYDSQCITIDGKDTIIFSGAFLYFRCPKQLWADRFTKLKAAGFNTLETYAAWNYHEQSPPENPEDFSKLDMTDLHDWLTMATDQFGFNVILRPGPYICAEWDGGGYPQWLLTRRPKEYQPREWYRSDDPTYLAWSRHWYTAVAKVAVPFQITHRPAGKAGIILWQIENEYDYSDQPVEVKHRQLDFLAHASRDLGIDVPLTTCLTDSPVFRNDEFLKQNVIETRNTYPKFDMGAMWRDIGMLYRYQPEKFKMITELQGGWFAQVGGKLSEEQGFDETHINNITLNAWENGFTATNYYMGFGGTNFGDWAATRLTTTYDYDAPLRECGGRTARYFAVAALGQFIAEHGQRLARSEMENFRVISKTDKSLHVALRLAKDGSRYLFLRNENRGDILKGTLQIQTTGARAATINSSYDLGSFGAKVLYLPAGKSEDTDGGVWYPKPQDRPVQPTDLPAPIAITDIRERVDSGPTSWKPFNPDQTEEQAGIFNRQYVFYHATVPPTDTPANKTGGKLTFTAQLPGLDWAGVQLDHKRISATGAGRFPLGNVSGQPQDLLVLFENEGRPNFGNGLEQPSGLLSPRVAATADEPIIISGWKEQHVDRRFKPKAELQPSFADANWPSADVLQEDGDLQPATAAIYRATVELTDAQLKTGKVLTLGRVDDDGEIYVNGEQVGTSHDWTQAQHFDVTRQLHAGRNSIVVHVINREGAGGLSKGTSLEPVGTPVPLQWELSQQTQGVAGKWWDTDLDDSGWTKTDGKQSDTDSSALLKWYRMKFELPTPKADEWIPWRVTLNASGNGFLYLNGHALGRWWEVGPQHDYFLPECWLNFGPGKTNVLTVEMRPTQTPMGIQSAVVHPYENLAEMR